MGLLRDVVKSQFANAAEKKKLESFKGSTFEAALKEKTGLGLESYSSLDEATKTLSAVQNMDTAKLKSTVESAEAPAKVAKGSIAERVANMALDLLDGKENTSQATIESIPEPTSMEQATQETTKTSMVNPGESILKAAATTTPVADAIDNQEKLDYAVKPVVEAIKPAPASPLLPNATLPTGQSVYINEKGEPTLTKSDTQLADETKIKTAEAMGTVKSKQAADLISAQKQAQGTYRFAQQFTRSWDELKAFDPEIDKEGFDGWSRRQVSQFYAKVDGLPETKALMIQIKPMANKMARDIEGGRVTDTDRTIYANSFAAAYANPGVTNMRLLSYSIINLLDQGGYDNRFMTSMTSHLKQLASMNHPFMNKVIEQVLIEYPDMARQIGYEVIDED